MVPRDLIVKAGGEVVLSGMVGGRVRDEGGVVLRVG